MKFFWKIGAGHQLKRFMKFLFLDFKDGKRFHFLLHQILLMNSLQTIHFIIVDLKKFFTENKYSPPKLQFVTAVLKNILRTT